MVEGVSVVTTTWNERENIKELILRIRSTLKDAQHEIIVVDGSSTDETIDIAKQYADIAVSKVNEGQTKGLLHGMGLARFPVIVTIDSDLENPPEIIPELIKKLDNCDVVNASRSVVPRFSERWAAKTLGKIVGVSDFYSNFRAFKKEVTAKFDLEGGETFGGEMLIIAKRNGFKIGELTYEAPPRRNKPRIGGNFRANLRISLASWKCFILYLF